MNIIISSPVRPEKMHILCGDFAICECNTHFNYHPTPNFKARKEVIERPLARL
jgi:hypothetical protein